MENSSSKLFVIYFLFVWIIFVCQSQSITQPQLTSVVAINSTALTITWQFPNATYDQSNYVQIWITFTEFFYNYNYTYPQIIYTYTSANKTGSTLTKNFQLVHGFVFICFASNSTITNVSYSLYINTCQLARTCTRENSSVCPSASFILLSPTSITSSSFVIVISWLSNLPYTINSSSVQLINTGTSGTALTASSNSSYYNQPYQFSGLSSQTNYTVNVSVSYTLFNTLLSENWQYSIVTSDSFVLFSSGQIYFSILCLIIIFILF